MTSSQEAEAGRVLVLVLVPLPQLPVDRDRAAWLEPWVLGSGLDWTPELRIQAHVGAGLWEVSIQPLSFVENLTVPA